MSDNDDSIYVRISATVSELVDGMHEATTVVQESVETMKSALAALTLAVAGGEVFKELIEKTTETGVQLEIMASKTGAAVEDLSRLNYAAGLSHVSVEELSNGMQRLARNMEEAERTGTTPAAYAFKSLGVSLDDTNGRLRPLTQVLTDVAQRFSVLQDGTAKTALAMDLFGRSGANLLPFLDQGAAGIKRLEEESDKLGNTWSQDDVEAAVKYEDAVKRLEAQFSGLERNMAVELFPILEDLIALLYKMGELTITVADGWKAIFAALHGDWNSMFVYADRAAAALQKAQDGMGTFATAAPTTGGAGEPPPVGGKKGPSQLDQWKEEWNKLKETELGGENDLLVMEIFFWQKKLAAAKYGSQDYIEIHSHVVDLETQLAKRTAEEQAKAAKAVQDAWLKTFEEIPKAWASAVQNWKQKTESMGAVFRDVMRSIVDEAASASARMIIIHNAEWLEKKKNILEGHALEVAQSAWSMLKVVADYAAKAAAAAWSALAGIPIVGPALGAAAAAATLAGVLALASGGGGGGGGAGGGGSSAAASATRTASGQTTHVYHINAVDAQSFHNLAMANAPAIAKAAAAGAAKGVGLPTAPGRRG